MKDFRHNKFPNDFFPFTQLLRLIMIVMGCVCDYTQGS